MIRGYLLKNYFDSFTENDLIEINKKDVGSNIDATSAHGHERSLFTYIRNRGYINVWRDSSKLFK